MAQMLKRLPIINPRNQLAVMLHSHQMDPNFTLTHHKTEVKKAGRKQAMLRQTGEHHEMLTHSTMVVEEAYVVVEVTKVSMGIILQTWLLADLLALHSPSRHQWLMIHIGERTRITTDHTVLLVKTLRLMHMADPQTALPTVVFLPLTRIQEDNRLNIKGKQWVQCHMDLYMINTA